jgi:hypothetical protein
MPKFVPLVVGGVELAGGAAAFLLGGPTMLALAPFIIAAGPGAAITWYGTLVSPGPADSRLDFVCGESTRKGIL